MPALGESVTEGTVTRWLKAEGDQVEVDEPLLEVSTDKVDTEIPSPVAGTVSKILVGEDETVPVGAELAVVGGSGGGSAPAPQQEQEQAPQQAADTQASDGEPAGTSLQDEAAVHEQAAEQSLQEEKPRGQAPGHGGHLGAAGHRPAQQPHRQRSPHRHRSPHRLCRRGRLRLGRWRRGRRRGLRHPARAQARGGARRRPRLAQGHRRRRPHPQAGRPRRRRGSPQRPQSAAGAVPGVHPGCRAAGGAASTPASVRPSAAPPRR